MSSLADTLIPFIGGLIIGGLLVWLLLPARRRQGKIEKEKQQAAKELTAYKQKVDSHFVRTAELVNNMTQSYRAIHDQLSQGVEELCSDASKQRFHAERLTSLASEPAKADTKHSLQQPLDYAPKSQGTLAEDFGFKKTQAAQPVDPSAIKPPRDYAAADKEHDA